MKSKKVITKKLREFIGRTTRKVLKESQQLKVKNVGDAIKLLKVNKIPIISKKYITDKSGYIIVNDYSAKSLLASMGLLIYESKLKNKNKHEN